MKNLPSKKVLSVFIVIAALVTAVIIAFGQDKSDAAIKLANNLVAGDKITVPENPNWLGELGSINSLADLKIGSTTEISQTKETATDAVSKSLIANYLALKQNGNLDQTSAQKLIAETANLASQLGGKTTLSIRLNIVPDSGFQSITDYGEGLGNVFKNNKPGNTKNEMTIISDAVKARDQSKLGELDPIIAVYEKIAADLEKMPVPKTFAKAHTDMTGGVKGMAAALKEIKNIFDDPVKSLTSMQFYNQSVTAFIQSLTATRNFIIQNKIIYKQGTGGYYLLYGI